MAEPGQDGKQEAGKKTKRAAIVCVQLHRGSAVGLARGERILDIVERRPSGKRFRTTSYYLTWAPFETGGISCTLEKFTIDGGETYHIRLLPGEEGMTCTCQGFRFGGNCRHLKALEQLQAEGEFRTDRGPECGCSGC